MNPRFLEAMEYVVYKEESLDLVLWDGILNDLSRPGRIVEAYRNVLAHFL